MAQFAVDYWLWPNFPSYSSVVTSYFFFQTSLIYSMNSPYSRFSLEMSQVQMSAFVASLEFERAWRTDKTGTTSCLTFRMTSPRESPSWNCLIRPRFTSVTAMHMNLDNLDGVILLDGVWKSFKQIVNPSALVWQNTGAFTNSLSAD